MNRVRLVILARSSAAAAAALAGQATAPLIVAYLESNGDVLRREAAPRFNSAIAKSVVRPVGGDKGELPTLTKVQ